MNPDHTAAGHTKADHTNPDHTAADHTDVQQLILECQSYREALSRASSLFKQKNKNEQIAIWLMEHVLGGTKYAWVAVLDDLLPDVHKQMFAEWVERVVHGEPYQYIVGEEQFYGRDFDVHPAVLIPRPETEILVQAVLDNLQNLPCSQQEHVARPNSADVTLRTPSSALSTGTYAPAERLTGVDVGTGSGIIAITLTLESQRVRMFGADIAKDALAVARRNAQKHGADVSFIHSDLLAYWLEHKERVDFIVSNPPYIPLSAKKQLDQTVVCYEPHEALFAEDEFYYYEQLIRQASTVLKRPGLLAFETGSGQAQHVCSLIKNTFSNAHCHVIQDLRGIERVVLARIDDKSCRKSE